MCSKIQPCSVATDPMKVRYANRSELAMNVNVNAGAGKRKAQSAGVGNTGHAGRAHLVQGQLWYHVVQECKVNATLSKFFDGLGIAHSEVRL